MLALVKILASLGSGRLKPMPLDFEDAVIFAGALGLVLWRTYPNGGTDFEHVGESPVPGRRAGKSLSRLYQCEV